jgi:5-methylcytosine-specific restriction endonuclease McrA
MAIPYVAYTGPVVTRAEALAAGLTRYFTGKPCKHGHLSERTSCNGGCIACNTISIAALYYAETTEQRATRNARTKAWKDAHREQIRAAGRAYSMANREQANAWKTANRDQLNAAEREARLRDPEPFKARTAKYLATDKGKYGQRARTQNYQALRRGAEGSHSREEIWELYASQKGKCVYCRASLKDGYHADHIQPVSKGGSNWITNIQLTCGPCNIRKHATDPIEFAQRLGRLL